MAYPTKVRLVEMGPRDGLQNEKSVVTTATKLGLIDRLADAGLTLIEAGSFVSPKWVPQMADSADVFAGLTRRQGVRYTALTPNMKGLEGAIAAKVDEVSVFAAASESFSQKNINCSIEESLERFVPIMDKAKSLNLPVRGYVSCVLGCPYEGAISPQAVARVADRLWQMGCYEISLGDTIGTGTPLAAQAMVDAVNRHVPVDRVAAHFHDTYGQALANLLAVMERGVAVIDSSVAGLGGCPYAKGASGNVASEDVLYMLNGMGISTGVNLDRLVAAGQWISDQIGRANGSRVGRARQG